MRAQVVLLRGDEILMARHQRPGDAYWVLPGGAVEPDEAPQEAAVREMREETGLEIAIDRLLFIDGPGQRGEIVITSPRYTYLARAVGGQLACCSDLGGGRAENGFLSDAAWMPFDAPEFDRATVETLQLVRRALSDVSPDRPAPS